ncbi:MAG: tRNA glutamyl-Q(34) synthetase GluQRS [Alphaproteobacteria bacterium]|nr:tRNA glutamyl-Q(34) synthetase GluQRS [Alphaproteobacteria bacterium]
MPPTPASAPPIVTRFAPSPTGRLHLGHLFSALHARRVADDHGGEMRLRIDDIDHTRCRPEFTQGIHDDLAFMGIDVDGVVMTQSSRMARYQDALAKLKTRGLVYPCFLTRRELDAVLSAPHGEGDEPHAANTDRLITDDEIDARTARGELPAWRLRMEEIRPLAQDLTWTEDGQKPQLVDLDAMGDMVVARKDIGTSYHLSVVLDDDDAGVTHVTRGEDLKSSTPLHRLIGHLLGIAPPVWMHHRLITDQDGKRLAKRDDARSIASLRDAGMTRNQILNMLGD